MSRLWRLLISLLGIITAVAIPTSHRPKPKPNSTTTTLPARPAVATTPAPVVASTTTTTTAAAEGKSITVDSTAYCQGSVMANGHAPAEGDVAANEWPLGTRLAVSASPDGPETVTVTDRIGAGSELDFYVASCARALQWGRRNVTVRMAR